MAAKDIEKFKFVKGESGNPAGRPKKFISSLKAQGYKLSEINDCIRTMLSLTLTQLKEAMQNPMATVMEMIIASAIKKAITSGDLSVFETLVSRTYGKPKETIEITTAPEVQAARNLYASLTDTQKLKPQTALKQVLTAARVSGFDLTEDDILDADTIG